jgi:hypothetical protein
MAKTYDRLFSYAIDTDVTVADMLQYQDEHQLLSHFAILVLVQAYNEFQHVQTVLATLRTDPEMSGTNDH